MLAVKFIQVLPMLILPAFSCNFLYSQSSRIQDPAVNSALRIYAQAAGDQAPYYNGIQYRRYPNYIHYGQPFFIADSLTAGTITYDDVTYENVKLQYDEVNDELITTDLQGHNLVQLFKQKISAFSIGPHKFINLSQTYPRAGYYRVLYNGAAPLSPNTPRCHSEPPRHIAVIPSAPAVIPSAPAVIPSAARNLCNSDFEFGISITEIPRFTELTLSPKGVGIRSG